MSLLFSLSLVFLSSGQTLLYQPSAPYPSRNVTQRLRCQRSVRLAGPAGKGTDTSVSTSLLSVHISRANVIISFVGNLLIQPIVNGGTVLLNPTFFFLVDVPQPSV